MDGPVLSVSCILLRSMCITALRQNRQVVDEWQSKIRMAKQSVDALFLKDLQLGLENGQFTAKKHTVWHASLTQDIKGC